MIVALFDSDGTLYTGQFGRGMMKYSTEHNRRFFAWRYYAGILPAYAAYKAKLGSWQNLQHALLANLSGMLQGLDQEQARTALNWLIHDYLLPSQRADVFKRLKGHQAQGHKVIIVSGMRELVQSRSWDVDWDSSFAYGDSFTDHYMLDLVGHPVAVYPDAKLHALAQEKNWEVLGTPKD